MLVSDLLAVASRSVMYCDVQNPRSRELWLRDNQDAQHCPFVLRAQLEDLGWEFVS